jgi:anaerobic magnesium-protoporphyrin IX monomethyl ester cyclase
MRDFFKIKNRKPRMALIWPWGFNADRVLPLALAYLVGNIDKEKYDIKIFDNSLDDRKASNADFAKELHDFDPDVVGVSGWTHTFFEMRDIIKVARKQCPEAVVLAGGVYATAYSVKALENLSPDFVIMGEAEKSFPQFLHELFNTENPDWSSVAGLVYKDVTGTLIKNKVDYIEDLDELKWPDLDAIDFETYLDNDYRYKSPLVRSAPIWVTRGCPYKCTFCAAPAVNGSDVRTHSVAYMKKFVEHLVETRNIKWFNIIDDNFTLHVDYAKDFCKEFIDLNLPINFSTPNGVRMQRGDTELWKLMKKAGWDFLVIAPESGSQNTLRIMKKGLKVDQVPHIVKEIKSAKLKVHGFFIIGYPGENKEDLYVTKEFIIKSGIDFPIISYFQPLPGTPIYDTLVQEGKIADTLIPFDHASGEISYKSPELEGVNLAWFSVRIYLELMVRRPRIIWTVVQIYGIKLLFHYFSAQFAKSIKFPVVKLGKLFRRNKKAAVN